jgi:phage shock protein PspC (stress-responsive transcriptional regulator)
MEKVFQIHLGGMLFTIEEQAYQRLKSYLDKMHQHFATHADVVQDIEGRMAELFNQKLSSGRTTLFLADVESVTATMGNIDQMDEHGETHARPEPTTHLNMPGHRKLRRNPMDQSLGGVCSGIASFFDVDPVLVRVLFVILLVVYGSGVLLYLILWVVLPEAKGEEAEFMKVQRQNKTKRLYRDADNRVIGGVSAGLSNYFGLDRAWIRLAFVLSVFLFGTGFWLYIVLWIIVPKAISATDKLLMRGEPIDIHSIEKEVKYGVGSNKVNSIAQHGSNVIGKIIRGFLKLLAGFFALVLFALVVGISVAMVAVFFNLGQTHFLNELIAFTVQNASIVWAAKIGVLMVLVSPIIGLLLIVVRALFKLQFINKNWAISLVSAFLIGVGFLLYAGISFGTSISHTESKLELQRLPASDTLYLEGMEIPYSEENSIENDGELVFKDKGVLMGKNEFYLEIDEVKLKQSKTDSMVLKIVRRANGKDAIDANGKIEMISYQPIVKGNKIIIPNYFSLTKDKQFSWQEVDVTLWVPEGKMIHIDPTLKEILNEQNLEEADGEYYMFTKGVLSCIDCQGYDEQEEETDLNEEDASFNFKVDGKDDNVEMEIKISDDGNGNKKKTKKVISKDGKEITIEESTDGPVTVKTRTEKKLPQ